WQRPGLFRLLCDEGLGRVRNHVHRFRGEFEVETGTAHHARASQLGGEVGVQRVRDRRTSDLDLDVQLSRRLSDRHEGITSIDGRYRAARRADRGGYSLALVFVVQSDAAVGPYEISRSRTRDTGGELDVGAVVLEVGRRF